MSRLLIARKYALGIMALTGSLGLSGCMADYSGQNLPTGYYLSTQVQYFPPGPEFKLSNEAAAQKAYRDTQELQQGQRPGPLQ